MINILIVDDSPTQTLVLTHLFEQEKDMCVIGCAENGRQAVELASHLKPDIITMDINMPVLNGLDAIRQIMTTAPVPIIVISSSANDTNQGTAFKALEAGALSVLDKPKSVSDPNFALSCQRILTAVRSMAEINVVKKRFALVPCDAPVSVKPQFCHKHYEIVAIGSSVGGPQALKEILSRLPADFSVPIVIVQHMSTGFIQGLAKWLAQHCELKVKCVENHETLTAGTVYFAPDDCHFKVHKIGNKLISLLQQGKPVSGFYPSITVLFNSVAKACEEKALAMLLTGMGSDGSHGLLEVKTHKGHTLIQDEKSCVIFGMAEVAQNLGAADIVMELDNIASYLTHLFNQHK